MADDPDPALAFDAKYGPPVILPALLTRPFHEVEKDLLNRLERHGDDLTCLWEVVTLYTAGGRKEKAAAYLERFQELEGRSEKRAEFLLSLGMLYENLKDFDNATAAYRQAVDEGPSDVGVAYFAHNNLAYCLNLRKRHAEAEKLCRTAIWIDPRRYNAQKNLGVSLQGLGRWVEAGHAFLEANRLFPPDRRAVCHFLALVKEHPEVLEAIPKFSIDVLMSESH